MGSPAAGPGPVATVCVEVEAGPGAFLREARGQPRGFWAKGERWLAHAGVLASVEAGAGSDRFGQVEERAAGWSAGPAWPGDAPARLSGRLRFFGGFSFRDDHGASGVWSAFPPALFHLPAVELVGDAGGRARLRVRGVPRDGDHDGLRARLEARAHALAGRLEALPEPPPPDAGGRPVPEGDVAATDRGAWEDAVGGVLAAIREGAVSKVVLARTLDVVPRRPRDPVPVVEALRAHDPGTHVFLFEPVPGRALVGAAPETVATLRRGVFHATAVAGSVARGEDEEERRELARRLLASAKDRSEQRIALNDVLRRLAPLADEIHADPEPHVLTLARIQHLESEVRARVPGGRTVLELLAALHPTPAVCGLPRDAALALIRDEEPFERGWYAGPVGFFDLEGNGVFAPALRSAVVDGVRWRLFAGAGIVEGSRPALEWEETGIKFEPVLRALAAAGAP